MKRRRLAWLLLALPSLGGAGCAGPPWRGGACPVAPVPTQELPTPLRMRSRVQLSAGEHGLRVETAAQGSADELVIVGMAPYGVRLFAVRQRGAQLATEALASDELRPAALWVADALHRIYWIEAPPDAAPDGVTRWSHGAESVSEWRAAGRPLRRRYARKGASGEVSIDYPDSDTAAGVAIDNPWCGYEAVVVNLDAAGTGRP